MDPRRRLTTGTPATCTYNPHRSTPPTSPPSPGDSRRPQLVIALPVDFTAFCELHHPHYTRYARLRLDAAAADRAVETALGDLAVDWPRVLRSPNPAAWAWNTLKARITQALNAPRPTPNGPPRPNTPAHLRVVDDLRDHLPEHLADIVALHYALHLTTIRIADLIGTDPTTVTYHLRTAERRLADLLPQHPTGPRPAAITSSCP